LSLRIFSAQPWFGSQRGESEFALQRYCFLSK
jgi:hypothetical protein